MSKSRFNFFAAVYLIAKKENKVLLIRRFNTGWMDGMYTLPAGHIDGNETAQTAMFREAKEEVNLSILANDLHVVHTMHRKAENGREYFDIFLEAKSFSGEIKNNEENKCDEIGWFSLDSLPENTLDYVKEVFNQISKREHYSSFGF